MPKNRLKYIRPGALLAALAVVSLRCSDNVSPPAASTIAMAGRMKHAPATMSPQVPPRSRPM